MRLFVTAFGPFGKFASNPSEDLVCGLSGYATKVLPVSYRAVDAFARRGLPRGYDALLMVGVVGSGGDRMRAERVARNAVGALADVNGEVRGPGAIVAGASDLGGDLFANWTHRTQAWKPSSNAGDYLCNYLYYQATRYMNGVRTGFLHIPPFSHVPRNVQEDYLDRVLWRIEK